MTKLVYDSVGDVLYISKGDIKTPNKKVETISGLVYRYDTVTNVLIGITMVDYKEHWINEINNNSILKDLLKDTFKSGILEKLNKINKEIL